MFKPLIDWYLSALDGGGYPLIILLMAIESTILPVPSELVIPPAAILAHQGRFSMAGVILAATLGSWIGASITYWVSRSAGRPLILRYGKVFHLSEAKLDAAEKWVSHFGSAGVFISRLLPVVRHLIGIPMGMAKMNFKLYSLFTLLGSALWSAVLCWVGVVAGRDEQLMRGNLNRMTLWLAGFMVILGVLYFFLVRRYMKK